MSTLVFALVGYAITGSTLLAGLAATAQLLGQIVFRLPAGALVDRYSRRRVLMSTSLVGAAVYAGLALAAVTHHLTLVHLVLAGLVTGVADAFAQPATSAAIRTIVPAPQLPLAFTRLEARDQAVNLIGPPLGGALYSIARALPFALDAVSYGIAALAVTRIRAPLAKPAVRSTSLRADVAEGLRWVWQDINVRAMMAWATLINLAIFFVFTATTLRLIKDGEHPATIGLVEAGAAVGGLLGALVAPIVVTRARTGMATIATTAVMALIITLLALATDVLLIGGLLAACTFMIPATTAGISSYMVSVVPDNLQGRVNAAAGFVTCVFLPLVPLSAGLALSGVGGAVTTLLGAALLVLSLIPIVVTSDVRKLGPPVEWTSDRSGQDASPAAP